MGEVACKRRVDSSAGAGTGFYSRGCKKENERGREKPEAYVIYSWECYVGGSDHKGN